MPTHTCSMGMMNDSRMSESSCGSSAMRWFTYSLASARVASSVTTLRAYSAWPRSVSP